MVEEAEAAEKNKMLSLRDSVINNADDADVRSGTSGADGANGADWGTAVSTITMI